MSTMPIEDMQLRAIEQRKELHKTISDLREKVSHARERLKFSEQARRHLSAASALAALVGLAAGYACAGLFTRH